MKSNSLFVSILIATLCCQSCSEDIEPLVDPIEELIGVWNLTDFKGESCENQYISVNEFKNHYFSLHESNGFTVTIDQDMYCSIGSYSLKRIEIKNGDTTAIGIANNSAGLGPFPNSSKINDNYSIVNGNLINESQHLFGIYFPFHYPDFRADLNDNKISEYIIDGDKLTITSTGADNIRSLKEGEKLTYSFTSTWTKE